MDLRDRFFTPTTAKAIMSWRLLLGAGLGVALGFVGSPIWLAVLAGAGAYAGSVAVAMPKAPKRPAIDPFVLSEPWRQLVQRAQGADRRLRATVDSTRDGPLKDSLRSIAEQLGRGLDEAWEIARRGDELDDAVRRLDRTDLRSRLDTLRERAAADPSPENEAAVASVERQLAAADRIHQQSEQTVAALRLTQTQLDELVARASEVAVGAADTGAYRREVDELVLKLEALHQAVEETRTA